MTPMDFRPNFHFTPKENWMNDPNGLVYYKGEYHLFYQYNPNDNQWGDIHWGHAISKDLVNWKHLPPALSPDEHGLIFSGCCVVDWHDSSGLGINDEPPLVALFTYHDLQKEKQRLNGYQTQGIAFSNDYGRSWKKYKGNPILQKPQVKNFRDPKVIWHAPSQRWIMVLAEDNQIGIYSSANLIDWQFESFFGQEWGAHGGVWECPDLFPLIDNASQEEKWVLLVSVGEGASNGGSGMQYFIGEFDGHTYQLDEKFKRYLVEQPIYTGTEKACWLDFGADHYAGVTWSDLPNRRVLIGWMNNWQYAADLPTSPWKGAMTLPRELSLKNGVLLTQKPVQEIESVFQHQLTIPSIEINYINSWEYQLEAKKGFKISFDLSLYHASVFQLILSADSDSSTLKVDHKEGKVEFNRSASGNISSEFNTSHFLHLKQNVAVSKIEIYVDVSSVEVFLNDGVFIFTELVFPDYPYDKIELMSNSKASIYNLTFNYHLS